MVISFAGVIGAGVLRGPGTGHHPCLQVGDVVEDVTPDTNPAGSPVEVPEALKRVLREMKPIPGLSFIDEVHVRFLLHETG